MAVFTPLINLTVNLGIVLLLWISRNQQSAQIGKLMASVNYMKGVMPLPPARATTFFASRSGS